MISWISLLLLPFVIFYFFVQKKYRKKRLLQDNCNKNDKKRSRAGFTTAQKQPQHVQAYDALPQREQAAHYTFCKNEHSQKQKDNPL